MTLSLDSVILIDHFNPLQGAIPRSLLRRRVEPASL